MAELIKVNKKVINDPLYTPVVKFLKERIAYLEANGPQEELDLARERYTGIVAGDLVLENAVSFPDGAVRACFVSRKTGFARADVDITRATMDEIIEDFKVPMTVINDVEHLKAHVKNNAAEQVDATLLWLEDRQTYGVLLTQESARTHAGAMKAFGDLFFEEYTITRDSLTSIDYDTLECGKLRITDPSFGRGTYPVFIYELVLAEANLPEITSNLPLKITTRRGDHFSIPNTYWFGGVEDITLVASVEFTTFSGYTIPGRSSDLLTLEGDTIFGSPTASASDQIFARVVYMWNGRPVKKTFTIEVTIERDLEADLVLVPTPATITASNGNTVEVTINAFFKGDPVTILVPPSEIKSKRKFGTLAYIKTNPDGGMVYRGSVAAPLTDKQESDSDLFSGRFLYNDTDGTPYWGDGYVNIIIVKPEVLPKFEVRNLITNIDGYKGDTGRIDVKAFYGDTPLTTDQIGLTAGIKGSKQLIEYTKVNPTSFEFALINDSGVPGDPTTDAYTQVFVYVDPNGIRHTYQPVFNVKVKMRSLVTIVPDGPQPRPVKRYEYGGPTFKVLVNGVDRTSSITRLRNKDTADKFITFPSDFVRTWQCLNTKVTESYTHTMTFVFDLSTDGEKALPYEFTQVFVIEPWNRTSGPNSNIVAVPEVTTIDGDSDEYGSFFFKVFEGDKDITTESKIVDTRTVVPDKIRFTDIYFEEARHVWVVRYFKDNGVISTGQIYAAKKSVPTPTDDQVGLVDISVDVKQIRILKMISAPANIDLTVGETKNVPVHMEFAGQKLALNSPNLKLQRRYVSDTTMYNPDADTLEFSNGYWRYVGTVYRESVTYRFTYEEPGVPGKYEIEWSFPITITYPPMDLIVLTNQIKAKIWDKKTFPLVIAAGGYDWTSAIYRVDIITPNKYIKVDGLWWEAYFAEAVATQTIVGIKLWWSVGLTTQQSFTADFLFDLAAWDGITFAITSYTPESVAVDSGDTGEFVVNLIYKGKDATKTAVMTGNTIPRTFQLGATSYDPDRGLIIPYTTKLGGIHDLKLRFRAPAPGTEITSVTIPTDIDWPYDLNIDTAGTSISGFWQDLFNYTLIINFDGTPVSLNDPYLTLTYNSGAGNPIVLNEVQDEKLVLLLDEGGTLATDYNYTSTIDLVYNHPTDGQVYTKQLVIPSTIRVSGVTAGQNPTVYANVWDRGEIPTRLTDERGRIVPITTWAPRGTSNIVSFVAPHNWYVINGSMAESIRDVLPITVGYDMGGSSYTLDVDVPFNVSKYDGKPFKVVPNLLKLTGPAGKSEEITLTMTYKGDPIDPLVDVVRDHSMEKLPPNVIFDEITADGTIPYTLFGAGKDTAKLVVRRTAGNTPGGVNADYVEIPLDVESISSDEPFSIVFSDSSLILPWGKTGTLKVVPRYSVYNLKGNSPGLKYTLTEEGAKAVSIVGANVDGVILKGIYSNVENAVDVRKEYIEVSYDVGAVTPKKATISADVTINMGPDAAGNNDKPMKVNIWQLAEFPQTVTFNDVALPSDNIVRFEIMAVNKYVEMTGAKRFEVIGAELTTSTQTVPVRVFYKVDATQTTQYMDFNAQFEIKGSSSVRFKVTPSSSKIEGVLDQDFTVSFTPVYKDQKVGAAATFRPELSSFPEQVELKSYEVIGTDYVMTFTGKKGGMGSATLVFWSPDATTTAQPRDVATLNMSVQILGELGLEVGNRSNLLTGASGDTGTYTLQLLFGALPVDMAAEIARGNLTVTREVGAASSNNANVLSLTTIGVDTFDYRLYGPVAPGKTIAVSDYLNVVYKFGGVDYPRRIEIPLSYTTPSAVATVVNYPGKAMWQTGAMTNPTITCDGVTMPAPASLQDEAAANGYVTFTGKNWEVINADTVASQKTIPVKYLGIYRNWTYEALGNTTWNLAAWNGYTFEPQFATSWVGYLGFEATVYLGVNYKGAQASPTQGWDYVDRTLTDFKGLFTMEFTGNDSFGGRGYAVYKIKPLKVGKDTVRIAFRRYNTPNPGVEKIDYTYVDLNFECKPRVLTVTGGPIAGGNGDVVAAPLSIKLTDSTGAQTVNVAPNNANLTIVTDTQDHFKITGTTATGLTVEITEPLGNHTGTVTTKLTLTYNDPAGVPVTKDYDYVLYRVPPKDYPTVVVQPPFATGSNKLSVLWDHGGFTNWFKVYAGPDATYPEITAQCDILNVTGPWVVPSRDLPEMGDRWWIVDAPRWSSGFGTHTYTFKVPFRGGFIDNYDLRIELYSYGEDSSNPFIVSTTANQRWPGNKDSEVEIPFNIKWRGYKYGKAVHRPDLAAVSAGGTFASTFSVLGQRYDADTGITYLKVKLLKDITTSVTFYFDHEDAGSAPVQGKTQSYASTIFSSFVVTPVASAPVDMWQTVRLNTLFKIMDNNVDITAQATLLSVDDPLMVITQATNASLTPSVQFQSHDVNAGGTRTVTFTVQLPATYQNRIITYTKDVVLNPFDGKEFKVKQSASSGQEASGKLVIAIGAQPVTDANLTFREVSSNTAALVNISSPEFLAANPDLVTAGIQATRNPDGFLRYYNWTVKKKFNGKIKIPVNYIGAGSTDFPVGTLDKNFLYIEQDVVAYEEKLYAYPTTFTPAPVSGAFNAKLTVPIQLSMGEDVTENLITPTTTGVSWTVPAGNGMVAKPASGHSTATGIVLDVTFNNQTADVTKTIPITFTYSGTYRGRTVTSTVIVNVDVTVIGTGTGDVTVSMWDAPPTVTVWDIGAIPYGIQHNGVIVPINTYKSITVSTNPYVRSAPNSVDAYKAFEVYNGLPAGVTTAVEFTVVFPDGPRDITFKHTINFTINPYNGIDLTVSITPNNNFCTVGTQPGGTSYLGFGGIKYRGKTPTYADITNKVIGVWPTKSSVPGHTFTSYFNSGSNNDSGYGSAPWFVTGLLAQATDLPDAPAGVIYFGVTAKENDPTAVEGKDFIKIPITATVYNPNKFYPVSWTKEIEGVFGNGTTPAYPLNIQVRKGITTGNAVASSSSIDNQDFITPIGSGSGNTAAWSLAFKTELTSAPTKTKTVTLRLGGGADGNLYANFPIQVTQKSNFPFPEVTDLYQLAVDLNQSGTTLPFKIMDGTTDITDQATVTAVAANSYIDFVDGKWHVYSARSGDTTVTVTLTYSILYKGNTLLLNQDCEFLIRGSSAAPTVTNVTEVTGNVWDKGTGLPFTINMNGVPIPANWITATTGSSPNSRVTVGPTVGEWKIVGGDTSQALRETVRYTVTVTTGTLTWTVVQDVVFNINKYDGIEFKLKVMTLEAGNANLQAGFYVYNTTRSSGMYVEGYYRGEKAPSVTYISHSFPDGSWDSAPYDRGNHVAISLYPNYAAVNSIRNMVVNMRRGGATGSVQGVDIATITIPLYMVGGLTVFPSKYVTRNISGVLGTEIGIVAQAIKYTNPAGSYYIDLTNNGSVTFSPANIIEVVPGSITPQGFKVRFKADVNQSTVTSVTVTVKSGTDQASWPISVTQGPAPDYPDVTANVVNASINQSGTIPFTLTEPGTGADVTSGATITAIAANSYVNFTNGKWLVYTDVAVDTPVTVKFTYTLVYHNKTQTLTQDVPFIIKPAPTPTVTGVTAKSGLVWDRGAAGLPFTINVNGVQVPAGWIKTIAAVSPNSRVTVGTDGSWQIVAGDQTQAVTEPVTYTVGINTGANNFTVTQVVNFNISKYDGIEFKAYLRNMGAGNDGVFWPSYRASGGGLLYVAGVYRGDVVNCDTAGIVYDNGLLQLDGTLYNGTPNPGWQFYGRNTVGVTTVHATIKRTGTAGTTNGVDKATVSIPTAVQSGGFMLYNPTTTLTGKYGQELDVNVTGLYPNNVVDFTNPVHTLSFSPANVIEMVPGSLTAKGFKVRFKEDVPSDVSTNVTITINRPIPVTSANFTVFVTQNSTIVPVDGTGRLPIVTIGSTDKIRITGSYGAEALGGHVTFDAANSDAKGLFDFGALTANPDGTIDLAVTAKAIGKDTLTIRLKTIGATGSTEGVDFLTLTVLGEVLPTEMVQSDNFATTITGSSETSVTVTQYVVLPDA